MTPKPGDTVEIDVEFPCPYCGAKAGASSKDYAVIHAMPHCSGFRDADPIKFVRDARKQKEQQN